MNKYFNHDLSPLLGLADSQIITFYRGWGEKLSYEYSWKGILKPRISNTSHNYNAYYEARFSF